MAAEAGFQIGAARAQHNRCGDAAGKCQIGANGRCAVTAAVRQFELLAGPHWRAPVRRNGFAIQTGVEIIAGQCEAGVAAKAYFAGAHGDFETGGLARIAHQQIGADQRQGVQGAAGMDAKLALAVSSEILYGAEDAWLENLYHLAIRSTVKRTRSPARSKVGGFFAGSNSDSAVRPSTCQPPGELCG